MAGSFQGVDQAKWDRIKAAVLAKTGITVAGDSGTAGAKGIVLQWAYDAATSALTIILVKRSFYDPGPDVIEGDIAALVQGA
jgi:hypothetical protein